MVAYDVLKAIYLERGYRVRDIPRLILEKNLFGLDIDDRAAQMAGFALLMKARADDRRLFTATDKQGNPQPPSRNHRPSPIPQPGNVGLRCARPTYGIARC